MNGTPRLRSAFPQTPQSTPTARRRQNAQNAPPADTAKVSTGLQSMPKAPTQTSAASPLIPFDTIDAPSQRLYILLFYGILHAWRFYDYYNLVADDTESFWAFLKWCGFDLVFIFGIPVLQIPWLEWSTSFTALIWGAHMVLNIILMFRVGIPIHLWLFGFLKAIQDDEMGLMGRSVKPGHIIQNASLILGKQIINILPEGSALLNPTNDAFCIGGGVNSIHIPIQINQTNPVRMEILHIDLENTSSDLITLSAKDIKKLRNQSKKEQKTSDPTAPILMNYPVKKTGLYILQRVVDETDLEVQAHMSELLVVNCPQARIKSTGSNRCRNELSDITMEVEGAPPLKVVYHRFMNGEPHSSSFQSIQPDDFVSPYGKQKSSTLVRSGESDLSWARSHTVSVPLSETLHHSGVWSYTIDEVQDALGNKVSYGAPGSDEEGTRASGKNTAHHQTLMVHERPKVKLSKCNYQKPLQVAKGRATALPLDFSSSGKGPIQGTVHDLEYIFTKEDDLTPNGEHGPLAVIQKHTLKSLQDRFYVHESGLYTLRSVSSAYCSGEVMEPASCLLQNPPEPEMSITTEHIHDKCAGNPIGIRLDLDLIGTPPFDISWIEEKSGSPPTPKSAQISGLRGQIILQPSLAGKYTYRFLEISDAVYKQVSLGDRVTQDVKPAASARFTDDSPQEACIDGPVSYGVRLQGEGPFTLEYELVHGGKRSKRKEEDISGPDFKIQTEPLKSGGDYSLVLTGITDRLGCKEFLDKTAKFKVRNERPKAYFGLIEGKRSLQILEGKKVRLPLRLTGKPNWMATYRNLEQPEKKLTILLTRENDALEVSQSGTYELVSLYDANCPGSIEESGKRFDVGWVPRPGISIPENPSMTLSGDRYIKNAVCEGDEDSFDVMISGTPPYDLEYTENIKPDKGPRQTSQKQIKAALGVANVRVDTMKPGIYEYDFNKLNDANYLGTKNTIIVVEQRVHPRPDGQFEQPGKTYSYCSREADGEEVIPVKLTGVPPFTLEVEIKHLSGRSRSPEYVTIPNIPSNLYELRISHKHLQHGVSNVFIRKIRDSRGCQRRLGADAKKVSISVHDAPTITAVESRTDYCVGERLSYTLSGTPPFQVFTKFNDKTLKAASPDTSFRRLAEAPGAFAITGISDNASNCRANTNLEATIHPMPTVRISQGRVTSINLREGGETEISFDFTGTPPFEVTYTRSTLANAKSGHKSKVLETRVERTDDFSIKVKASEEGQYEAVAIKDRWCAFPRPGEDGARSRKGQKLLQN
ncbi:nucleoporin Pom152 [Pseudovirgaria hyperparasitica]|uniref:Nucleoporin Pom152 n=1 Tax=Pseudovirgaria hyperparasitica TaxID=470096 RepID=A0A6A6WG04_9PEZI|nr:nucleoporin Pom152 [Pseudovirgaria hyperparasitica]KAF2760866.1 nucleoporin Pom152 [Pseudovirgaria hyperparasitica]